MTDRIEEAITEGCYRNGPPPDFAQATKEVKRLIEDVLEYEDQIASLNGSLSAMRAIGNIREALGITRDADSG